MAAARMVAQQAAKKRHKEQERRESLAKAEKRRRSSVDVDGRRTSSPLGRNSTGLGTPFEEEPEPKVRKDLCFGNAKHLACPASYLEFAGKIEAIATSPSFDGFIILVIILAGILVGVQMYEGYDTDPAVVAIDWCVLGIFIVEFVFKVIAEKGRPWRYFTGPDWNWNNFDFLIIFFCLPWPFMTGSTGAIKLLRLLRLMRVVKLVRKVPQLQMIVMGLVGGLASIGYIMLLLFLVFYIYGILGCVCFGENDPWHFGRLEDALNALFRMATLEDWTNIMYINMKGCAAYTDGIFFPIFSLSEHAPGAVIPDFQGENTINYYGSIISNRLEKAGTVFDGVLCRQVKLCGAMCQNVPGVYNTTDRLGVSIENYSDAPVLVNGAWDRNITMNWGDGINGAGLASVPIASVIFCVSFIVVSALVMLSLFIGAVTMSMTESMDEMKVQQERKDKARRMAKAKKEQARRRELAKIASRGEEGTGNGGHKSIRGGPGKVKVSIDELNQQSRMKSVLLKAWDGTDEKAQVFVDESIQSVPWKRKYNAVATLAKQIAEYPLFDKFVTCVILAAGVLVGCQTYDHFGEEACGPGESCDALQVILRQGAILDTFILIIFTIEVVVKFISEGFRPLHYFASGWNNFDFLIVFGSYLGRAGLMGSAGSLLVVLRLLRLLRILKLVKSLPQLQVIVIALIKGFNSIGFIGIILFMCFYIFAILAMILFSENDPFHFGTLDKALVSLFRASTLEDWTDIMYINMYGCEKYGYNVNAEYTDPVTGQWGRYDDVQGCNDPFKFATRACFQKSGGCSQGQGIIAAFYFVIFIVIGALVLLTLFIGVITTSMEEASEGMEKEKEVDDRVEDIRKAQNASQDTMDLYREVFQMLDFDGSQCIEAEELMLGLRMVGREPSPHELHAMMKRVDENDSGEIDFAEFVQFMFNLKADAAVRRASFLASTTPQLQDMPEEPTKMSAPNMLASVESEGVAKPEAVKASARSNQVVPSG